MEQTEQDRSEQPTPFKLDKARRKGTVARGTDLGFLTALVAFLLYMWVAGAGVGDSLSRLGRDAIVTAPSLADGPNELFGLAGHLLAIAARPVAFVALAVFATVLLFELVQTGVVFSAQPLKPDFSRLNPARGLKRLFSKRLLIETFKNVLKMAVYCAVTWYVARGAVRDISASVGDGGGLAEALFASGLRLVACFAGAALLFAALDQLIVRKEYLKQMRMSRRELRREARDREGEPRQKQKRKQLHAEFTRASESLRNVRSADVLITNPVHYAVALRYDSSRMAAPILVSRGANALARRLKRLAFIHGVTIVEDRALARLLYRSCAVDSPVPENSYRQVAGIYQALRNRGEARV